MAVSLGFHIVFAEIGIAMPLMMVLAEWRWRRTGDRAYYELAKRWAKGTAVLFAVGKAHAQQAARVVGDVNEAVIVRRRHSLQ